MPEETEYPTGETCLDCGAEVVMVCDSEGKPIYSRCLNENCRRAEAQYSEN